MEHIEPLLGTDALDSHLAQYQQNPYLLDPFFGQLVSRLGSFYLNSHSWALDSLYTLANIRGAKQTSKFLDTSPELLSEILDTLQRPLSWKHKYTLLLWLANLLLIPMKLEVLGMDFDKVYALLLVELAKVSKERDAAALAMARLLTREPSTKLLERFYKEPRSLGILQTLAHISTTAFIPSMLAVTSKDESVVHQKMVVKIRSRSCLLAFPRHWDQIEDTINFLYQLLSDESTVLRYSSAKALARLASKCSSRATHQVVTQALLHDTLESFSENVLPDTLPGRRLSQVSGDTWHGSLLFIAELLRFPGISLDLGQLFGVLQEALHFEQKRLGYTTGTNVRDAACYVCWAIFRRRAIEVDLDEIYNTLVSLACFDREVNIRRAAAAALQEGLGRHQGKPAAEILKIIETLNFASVANVAHCYLEIAPKLGASVDSLLKRGIASWDVAIQRLASSALTKFPDCTAKLLDMWRGDADCKNGVLMALGKTRPTLPVAHLLEYNHDFNSEIVCEALLVFCQAVDPPELAAPVAEKCMWASTPQAIEAAGQLKLAASSEWCEKLEFPCYVQALAAAGWPLEDHEPPTDPLARSVYMRNLRRSAQSEARAVSGLSDYQRTERGDVGSWVRLEAIAKARSWGLQSPALWRMAAEALDKLRIKSCEYLVELGHAIVLEPPTAFYASLLDAASSAGTLEEIMPGLVCCIGGRSGNVQLADAAFQVLVERLEALQGPVLALGWKGDVGLHVLYTIVRTLEAGYFKLYDQHQLLRLGYNSTINTRQVPRILGGIEVLGFLEAAKAHERLRQLCAYPSSLVRVRASEALFELGYDDAALVETDFT